MSKDVSNSDDVIDSRDVIARMAELQSDRDAINSEAAQEAWDEEADGLELAALKDLADGADGCGDWEDGAALIRESYWVEHVQELAHDIGAIGDGSDWLVIDWEATAKGVQMDYSSVDFDGVTYYVRS